MLSVQIALKAQFYDIDPMEVVWHGNYARFLEQARCELLDQLGYNYGQMKEFGHAWPIVDMRIKYVRPIRFGQKFTVTATIVEFENGLKIDYRLRDGVTDEVLTKARTFQVPVRIETGELCIESPAALTDRVRALA
jgi:acyl-CoA thioester hydrolase